MPTHCVLARGLKLLQSLASASFAVRSSFKQACLSPPTVTDPRAAARQLMLTSSSGGPSGRAAPGIARAIVAAMAVTVKARMRCSFPLASQRQSTPAVPYRAEQTGGDVGATLVVALLPAAA